MLSFVYFIQNDQVQAEGVFEKFKVLRNEGCDGLHNFIAEKVESILITFYLNLSIYV